MYLLLPRAGAKGIPEPDSQKKVWDTLRSLLSDGTISAAWALGHGGAMEGIVKCALGNGLGVSLNENAAADLLYGWHFGGALISSRKPVDGAVCIGTVTGEDQLRRGADALPLDEALRTMHRRSAHMAQVRAGGELIGLITLEDLIEEYVGTVNDWTHEETKTQSQTEAGGTP